MTLITDAMFRHYNELVARAEAEVLQNRITEQTKYDTAFKQRVLEAAKEDIVYDATTGWVFWPWQDSAFRGYWTAAALRVIADELDRRDDQEAI